MAEESSYPNTRGLLVFSCDEMLISSVLPMIFNRGVCEIAHPAATGEPIFPRFAEKIAMNILQ
jgi:hypothetical protein